EYRITIAGVRQADHGFRAQPRAAARSLRGDDDMGLNFAVHGSRAEPGGNRRRGGVRRLAQAILVARLDLVSQRRALTESDGGMAGRWRPAAMRERLHVE